MSGCGSKGQGYANALKQIRRWGSEMRRKGSVAQLIRKPRPGYILGEDGCLVAFDESALEGLDPGELFVGDWVEYEELDRMEERRASRIKPLIRRGEE